MQQGQEEGLVVFKMDLVLSGCMLVEEGRHIWIDVGQSLHLVKLSSPADVGHLEDQGIPELDELNPELASSSGLLFFGLYLWILLGALLTGSNLPQAGYFALFSCEPLGLIQLLDGLQLVVPDQQKLLVLETELLLVGLEVGEDGLDQVAYGGQSGTV